jgi:hypothetical protein
MPNKLLAFSLSEGTIDELHRASKTEVEKLDKIPFVVERKYVIYFLYDGDNIVYVGKSRDVDARIRAHNSSKKIFDSYSLYEVLEESSMDIIERYFINKYLPKYNQDGMTKKLKNGWNE